MYLINNQSNGKLKHEICSDLDAFCKIKYHILGLITKKSYFCFDI